jgi:hypothetical protein
MHRALWSPAWRSEKYQNGMVTYVYGKERSLVGHGPRVSMFTRPTTDRSKEWIAPFVHFLAGCFTASMLSACAWSGGSDFSAANLSQSGSVTPSAFRSSGSSFSSSGLSSQRSETPSAGPTCASLNGGLQLSAQVTRATGISPLLVFFDATATSDSAVARSVTQDVTFTWSFGDSGASGTGTWAYGSNPGGNSMNAGSGIVAAHLYRTAGSDTSYTATVTATDGTNTASCSLGVTAYDPSGPNGFPGTATTCVYNSSLGSGCPSGAATLETTSIQTALSEAYGDGKRILFKCGDTFTGDNGRNDNLTAVKWAIGAYGGCRDTTSNRPILSNRGSNWIFQFSGSNGEGTLSDLDCEGNGSPPTNGAGCIWADPEGVMYQDTLYNLYSNNEAESYNWAQCSQCGIVQSYMNGMGPGAIGSYFNYSGYAGYPYTGNPYNNVNYTALIGNHFDGGTTNISTNTETVRISGCPYCYITNNDFANSGPRFSQFKMHEENPYSAATVWVGQYTEYDEVSDNYFYGHAGAYELELGPQNSNNDERLRYIVAERNVFAATGGSLQMEISGVNITARDNVFVIPSSVYFAIQVYQRGIEPAPQYVEVYNNSAYLPTNSSNGLNAAFEFGSTGQSGAVEPSDNLGQNNLVYMPGNSRIPAWIDLGTGDTLSHNTSTVTNDPAWTNASGTLDKITDWKPTANYSGGTTVPVYYDALGTVWAPTWDLGAVHR